MNLKQHKALIFSDVHLRLEKIAVNEQGKLYLPVLNNILDIINKINPEYVFNLGDTFHNKDSVSAALLQIYREFLEKVLAKGIKVIQIVGNHDFSVVSGDGIAYHALKQYNLENFTVVNDIYRLDENNAFVSYCRTKELFDERVGRLGKVKHLFAHLDINGFNLGDDYIEKHAILNPEDFKNFTHVYSGHYHEAQAKVIDETVIVYIGSPYTTNYGETDQEKRVVLVDLITGEYESIPTNMTYHRTIRITAADDYPKIPDTELASGIKYRVIVKGSKEEIAIFNLKKPKHYKANVIPDITLDEKPRIELNPQAPQTDTLKIYAVEEVQRSYGNLDESGFDIEKLVKMGQVYINRAKNT